jgi:biopolymer transport protein ExbB
MKKLATYLLLLAACLPLFAHAAWWNEAWTERRTIVIDTSASGLEIGAALSGATLPVRLHSGNFDFLAARPDGADLRFVAADGKTVLAHRVERFDALNELAVVWVQVPQIAPKSAGQKLYLYFGNADARPEAAASPYDGALAAVLHFEEGDARPRDATANANHALAPLALETAGLLGASGRFEGAPLVLPASPSLGLAAAGGFGFSAWVRPSGAGMRATLYRQGPFAIRIEDGRLAVAGAGRQPVVGGALAPDQWQHVAVTVGAGETALYVDGARVAAGAGSLPAVQAEVRLGEGLVGLLDEVQLASSARAADWIRLAADTQGPEPKALRVSEDEAAAGAAGDHSYLGILIDNLTIDAWVVIVILAAMLVVAIVVMAVKARMVSVVDRDNRGFLQRFRHAADDFLQLDKGAAHPHSPLFRLYQAGVREMNKRADERGEIVLSGAALDAIKASVDADLVRESHKLNAKMVLLTIAISGGPFLGLLGTVVGVMITFAAIAAAGDVNVNAIAPGIAAALLATVAGLAVAIPALFGYNYLASRIKNISADMHIFVDEFITRIAEKHGR